jgi:hypothetical protein
VKVNPNNRYLPGFVLAVCLLVALGVWRWAEVFVGPAYATKALALAHGGTVGNYSDLYPYWLGTRELLMHGRDPYSSEVTHEIQLGFYGRRLDPKNPFDPKDREAFAYPLYMVFLMAPAAALPFRSVMEMFRLLLPCAVACSVPLWMYAIGFRPRRLLVISGMVLAISSFPALQEFYMQNLSGLVLLFLAAAAAATVGGWLVLSGFLLAISTIKPQLSGFFVFFFMVWATADWARRQRLFWSFLVSLSALTALAESLSPGWIRKFLSLVYAYQSYAADLPILCALLPLWLAKATAAALTFLVIWYCWKWRRVAAGTEYFGWAIAWVATVTLVLMPKLAAYNQPLLIPPWLVLLAHRDTIWKAGLVPRALVKGAFACQVWEWAAALMLALCSVLALAAHLRSAAQLPLYTALASRPITLMAVALATFYLPAPRILAAPRE